jgi:hypothetical protein
LAQEAEVSRFMLFRLNSIAAAAHRPATHQHLLKARSFHKASFTAAGITPDDIGPQNAA